MKREYKCEVTVSAPEVAYRETITQRADFNFTHKKQTGGSGQYGRVAGFMEPISDKDYEFVDSIKGGAIPNEYIPSCDKGFKKAMEKGTLIGAPVVNVRCTINDGQYHPVDSSDIAFQTAAIGAFREGYLKAKRAFLASLRAFQKDKESALFDIETGVLKDLQMSKPKTQKDSESGEKPPNLKVCPQGRRRTVPRYAAS